MRRIPLDPRLREDDNVVDSIAFGSRMTDPGTKAGVTICGGILPHGSFTAQGSKYCIRDRDVPPFRRAGFGESPRGLRQDSSAHR